MKILSTRDTMLSNITLNVFDNGTNRSYIKLQSSSEGNYTDEDIFLIISFSLILLVGSIGNSLVVSYFYVKKGPKRSIPDYLFSCLAIIDIITSIFNPALYIMWILTHFKWYFGYWTCKLLVPIGTIACSMSSGLHVIIAFDRQRSIVHPFKPHYKLRHINIGIVLSFVCSVVANTHYSYNLTINRAGRCVVRDVRAKEFSVPTIIYFILQDCMLIITLAMTNIKVFQNIRRNGAEQIILGHLDNLKRNRRIIRLLSAMTIMYFILTLPRDTLHIIHMISWMVGDGIAVTATVLCFNSVFKLLHTSNSCANFFIFIFLHQGFKTYLWQLVKSITRRSKHERRTSGRHKSQPQISPGEMLLLQDM